MMIDEAEKVFSGTNGSGIFLSKKNSGNERKL